MEAGKEVIKGMDLTTHEIDAVEAYLHLRGKVRKLSNKKESYIVILKGNN